MLKSTKSIQLAGLTLKRKDVHTFVYAKKGLEVYIEVASQLGDVALWTATIYFNSSLSLFESKPTSLAQTMKQCAQTLRKWAIAWEAVS